MFTLQKDVCSKRMTAHRQIGCHAAAFLRLQKQMRSAKHARTTSILLHICVPPRWALSVHPAHHQWCVLWHLRPGVVAANVDVHQGHILKQQPDPQQRGPAAAAAPRLVEFPPPLAFGATQAGS